MVRAVFVIELPGAVVVFGPQSPVFRVVQIVADGCLTQHNGLAVFVRKVLRVEQFPGFGVVNVQLPAHELKIHFMCRCVERPFRLAVEGEDQPLGSVVDPPRILILKLPGDQTGITLPVELGNLFAQAQRALRQGVPVFLFEVGDSSRHFVPLHPAAELRTPQGLGVRHQTQHRADRRGVHGIFVDFVGRKRAPVVEPERRKERARLGVEGEILPETLV